MRKYNELMCNVETFTTECDDAIISDDDDDDCFPQNDNFGWKT